MICVSQPLIHLPTLSTECSIFSNSLEEKSRNPYSMACPSSEEKERNFYAGLGSFKAVLLFVNEHWHMTTGTPTFYTKRDWIHFSS